ncbi:ribosome assembly factor SBDS [Candidatus Woesearchaeota archaeon]|nr:ribosome assembly factor SBDS [Candidatus Woesearchaeota archaeon]
MVTVDEAVVARLKLQGNNFEILVDCSNAIALREGKAVDMKDVLAARKVFSDAKKGMEASENLMKQLFNTTDKDEIARHIIKKGEIHLTTEYKSNLREIKKRKIISLIHRNGVDPKTHLPHPINRIENAMEEVKFYANEFAPVEEQLQEALKKLKQVLPIRFEVKEIEVKIAPAYAAKAYSVIKNYGTILRDEWQNNGYWVGIIEMPAGLETEFYEKINSMCHGEVEAKVLKIK